MKYISKLLVLFAIITMATACKDDIDEVNNPLSVTTPAVSAIKGTSAAVTSMATGSHITYRGICFSQSSNPTVDDYKVMAFQQKMSVTITGLQPNTTYYVRAFVQSSFETVYSDVVSFTTAATTVDTEDDPQAGSPADLQRVSVHDPSIVWDPASNYYYVFGSHRAAAKSKNMMSWEAFQAPWATATSKNAANADAFTTPKVARLMISLSMPLLGQSVAMMLIMLMVTCGLPTLSIIRKWVSGACISASMVITGIQALSC